MDPLTERLFNFTLSDRYGDHIIRSVTRVNDRYVITTDASIYVAEMYYDDLQIQHVAHV